MFAMSSARTHRFVPHAGPLLGLAVVITEIISMTRAGIFIGVDKTGNLQQLNDAAEGARRMYEWALAQGMTDQTHARLITDANSSAVTPDSIYNAIKTIIDGPGVEQLIVYFAGH